MMPRLKMASFLPNVGRLVDACDPGVRPRRDARPLTLVERKKLLAEQMAMLLKASVLFVGDFTAEAALFKQFLLALELEGFMAKRRDAPYTQGPERTRDWLKVKRKGAVPPERFKRP